MQLDTVYTPPVQLAALPDPIVRALDGDNLEARLGEAIQLSTLGEDGWPHAALLTVGEVLAVTPAVLLIAVWHDSHTAQNLRRDGRVTLSLSSDCALLELHGRAKQISEHQTALDLAVFRVSLERIHEHRSEYADVTGDVSFRLHDPQRTFVRWREQISALKKLA